MDTKKVTALTDKVSKAQDQLKSSLSEYVQAWKELSKETSGTVNLGVVKMALTKMLNESVK